MDEPIITEDNPKPFIIRVKLLTNEVFDFEVDKNIKVQQFKTLISPKVNVPVDRMRLVFAGKQLHDQKPMSDYVTQSGLTVHLIARTTPVNEQPAQSVPNPQPATNNTHNVPNMPPPQVNPFGDIMGMVNSMFGAPVGNQQLGSVPPQITMAFGNMNNMNNPLGGILGSLGLRMQNQPQQAPPQQSSQQQQQQPSQQPLGQQRPPRISYAQIGQLNSNLNSLNIPLDNVTTEQELLTPEGVIRYLRRLHHQSSRSMIQLNRLLNMAQNGNTANLQNFIPILQSLNSVNNVAIGCLNQLHDQRVGQQVNTSPTQNTTLQNRQQNQPNQPNQPNPVVNMEISVSQIVPNIQDQGNQPQGQQGFNPMALLGGLNLGNIMGQIDSVGGINGLFGMSLREMMSENGQRQSNGILIDLFGGMTGQHMMQAFTTKNFAFLRENRKEIRQNLKKKINQSNEQEVIDRITQEASTVLIPAREHPMIRNLNQCRQRCKKNLKKHIRKLVAITLPQDETDYDLKVVQIGKVAFCENVNIIADYSTNKNSSVAFQVIKGQAISTLDPILPGLSGLLYNLVERDMLRIYNEYQADQQRRNQMSNEEAESEQRLIELIKQAGNKDSAKLSNMPHSEQYYRHQD